METRPRMDLSIGLQQVRQAVRERDRQVADAIARYHRPAASRIVERISPARLRKFTMSRRRNQPLRVWQFAAVAAPEGVHPARPWYGQMPALMRPPLHQNPCWP